jgi:hypothetical protein
LVELVAYMGGVFFWLGRLSEEEESSCSEGFPLWPCGIVNLEDSVEKLHKLSAFVCLLFSFHAARMKAAVTKYAAMM